MNNRKTHEQFSKQVSPWQWFPSRFTVLVTPSHVIVCQEADLVGVVNAPWGAYSSSQLYPLPPLLPWATSGLTATVLPLLRLGWPLANPGEVFLRESAAGLVIVTVSGCSQLGPAQLQLQANPSSMGKLLVSVNVFLVCFSFYSLFPLLCLYLSSRFFEKNVHLLWSLQIRIYCGLGWHSDSNY